MGENNWWKSIPYRRMGVQAAFLIIAIALHILEDQLPLPTLLPGFRLGLANLSTLLVLMLLGPLDAMLVLVLRIAVISVLAGSGTYALYSFAGGIPAMLVLSILYALTEERYYYIPLFSAAAAAVHVSAQCILCYYISIHQLTNIYVYLLFFSIFSGFVLGLCAVFVYRQLRGFFFKLHLPYERLL